MLAIGDRLIARAQDLSSIQPEVRGQDVFALTNAAAWLRQHGSAEQTERLINLTFTGMRTAPPRRRHGR